MFKVYDTERLRRQREIQTKPSQIATLDHIARWGCSVIHVRAEAASPAFAYTVGVYDTCGQPELIAIGLREKTAQVLLNDAVELLRTGVDLRQGRYKELIGEVECEFRPVDPKWVPHVMCAADGYYEGADVPVLQAVYPDLENRFPEDPGFDEAFRQPLLQPAVPDTVAELDFWASCDPESSLFNWKFSDSPHTRAFVSQAVNTGQEPVTYVAHDADDGAWQFLGDSMTEDLPPVLVCLHHMIDRDRSLQELANLPQGWAAERVKPGAKWRRFEKTPEPE